MGRTQGIRTMPTGKTEGKNACFIGKTSAFATGQNKKARMPMPMGRTQGMRTTQQAKPKARMPVLWARTAGKGAYANAYATKHACHTMSWARTEGKTGYCCCQEHKAGVQYILMSIVIITNNNFFHCK